MSLRRFLLKRRWFLLGGLLTVIAIASYAIPAVQRVRDAAARTADA